jgi:DinB superfamily
VGSDGWCTAWVSELLGCFLNERSERAALRLLPEAAGAYLRWLRRHGERIRPPGRIMVTTAERWQVPEPLRWGNYEVLHGFERPPVTRIEVGSALRWMRFMRRDTLVLVDRLPPGGLDWTRPGQERTIRRHLYHVARAEQWYLERLNLGPRPDEIAPTGDPVPYLAGVRARVVSRLSGLTREERARIVQVDNGRWWSARKMLGRMLYHERYHIRSMARIARHHRVRVPEGLGGWSRY